VSDEIQDLDEMLGFLAEDGGRRRDPEEHPSPETLTAYQANELSPEEDERIQNHLAVCQHCTELLLDLEEFLKPPTVAAERAADFEAAADWRRLREGMGRETEKPQSFRMESGEKDYRLVRSLRLYQILAAVLGTLAVGLAFHATRLHVGPEILVPSPHSVYFATTRSADPSEKRIEIRLPCALPFATSSEYPKYRIEIVAGDGPPSYSVDTSLSEGIIALKTDSLKPGDYEIRLSGLRDGISEPIGDPKKLVVLP
jgi:hypothetical protein